MLHELSVIEFLDWRWRGKVPLDTCKRQDMERNEMLLPRRAIQIQNQSDHKIWWLWCMVWFLGIGYRIILVIFVFTLIQLIVRILVSKWSSHTIYSSMLFAPYVVLSLTALSTIVHSSLQLSLSLICIPTKLSSWLLTPVVYTIIQFHSSEVVWRGEAWTN